MNPKSPPDVATAAPFASDAPQQSVAVAPAEVREGVASALLEASPDCVKLLDPNGVIRFINQSGYTLMETDAGATYTGTRWAELWPQEMRRTIESALESARSNGRARFSGICPTAKGTPKWWDVVVTSIRDSDDKIDCFLCVSRDITAWKAAEESLTLSEQRFRALADNMAQFA